MLYDYYRNQKKKIRSSTNPSNREVDDEDVVEEHMGESSQNVTVDECENKNWLRYHIEPIDEIKIKWQASFALRRQEILNADASTFSYLSDIFQTWPLFCQSFGFMLVSKFKKKRNKSYYRTFLF